MGNGKKNYDLEERTYIFAKNTHSFIRLLYKDIPNIEVCKQLSRSSGSIGANYIEANEALSKKDYIFRVRICRKEAKETIYWFRLLSCVEAQNDERNKLIVEANELMKIFGSIIEKLKASSE